MAFTPSAPGLRSGAVALFEQGNNLPLTIWYLNEIGQSSAVTIDPGTQTTLTTLDSNGQAYGSVVDGVGNVYVVDNANSQVIKLAAGTFTPSTVVASGLSNPTALALDAAGICISLTQVTPASSWCRTNKALSTAQIYRL